MSRTASQTEVLLALAPRIDAPPDLVDDSDDDERPVVLAGAAMWPPLILHGGRSLVGRWPSLFQDSDNDLGARSPIRVGHITVGEMMPELIDDSDDDEMPALVADDPCCRGPCRSPAWGCAKPGRQG